MKTLLENLLEKDFKDVFKPADKEEISRRRQETLDSLDNIEGVELQDLATGILGELDDDKFDDIYSRWGDAKDPGDVMIQLIHTLDFENIRDLIRDMLGEHND